MRGIGGQDELLASEVSPDDADFDAKLSRLVSEAMRELEFLVGGFDFARVITAYYRAWREDGEAARARMSACLRWLRGEFSTKTEARGELGFPVSVIIEFCSRHLRNLHFISNLKVSDIVHSTSKYLY